MVSSNQFAGYIYFAPRTGRLFEKTEQESSASAVCRDRSGRGHARFPDNVLMHFELIESLFALCRALDISVVDLLRDADKICCPKERILKLH